MVRRVVPLPIAGVIAVFIAVAGGNVRHTLHLVMGLAITAGIVIAIPLIPWRRFHANWQMVPVIAFLAAIALVRDATGGADSDLTALVLLPILWLCFYGTLAQIAVLLTATALTLFLPAVIQGEPLYPMGEALVACGLWLAIGVGIAVVSRRLTSDVRRLAQGYRVTLDAAHVAFVAMGADGRVVEWNRAAESMLGWSRSEIVGAELAEVIVPRRLRAAHRQGLRRFLMTGERTIIGTRQEMPGLHRDGHEVTLEVSLSAEQTSEGWSFTAFMQDVSERVASDRSLREAEERFRSAFDDAAIGMAITSLDGRWLRVNEALAGITGYSRARLIQIGFADITHPDDLRRDAEALADLIAGRRQNFATEKRYRHADGHWVWVALNVSAVHGDHGETLYLIAQMQDITERKAAEAKLSHQALHDPLTGLPNRLLFNDRMQIAHARVRRGSSMAVLFCDLDDFKEINDGYGHDVGDRVLREAATRLSAVVRPSDTIARVGGDEFAILCEGVDQKGATFVAERLAQALDQPFLVGRDAVTLSASVGITMSGAANRTPQDLMIAADRAMYAAKRAGGGCHVLDSDRPVESEARE